MIKINYTKKILIEKIKKIMILKKDIESIPKLTMNKLNKNEIPIKENNNNENSNKNDNLYKSATDRSQNNNNNIKLRNQNKNFVSTKNDSFQIENNNSFWVLGTPICCKCKMSRTFSPKIQFYYCNQCMKMYCKNCICNHVTCSCIYERDK